MYHSQVLKDIDKWMTDLLTPKRPYERVRERTKKQRFKRLIQQERLRRYKFNNV